MPMITDPRTRLALLGTLSDLHRLPISFSLTGLWTVVSELEPDLLCAEVTPEGWARQDFTGVGPEVREALAEAVAATDIVLLPVAPSVRQFTDQAPQQGWRRQVVAWAEELLIWAVRRADRVEAVQGSWFRTICHLACWLAELCWSPAARSLWEQETRGMADHIIQAIERDPGRRVLVAVQCQRLHRLLPMLRRRVPSVELVGYQIL